MHKYNNNFMSFAIAEAKKCNKYNDVPIGAVIVDNENQIISKGFNSVEKYNNSLLHAEKIAIEKALLKTKNRYLENCDIWITLEPCIMCLGLIKLVRIKRLYFGATDKNKGLLSKNSNLFSLIPSLDIYSGIQEEECTSLLNNFFKKLRKNHGSPISVR